MNTELENDFLARSKFLAALHKHVEDLAAIPLDHLPAPRVLAVDAPWGSGKSWIAKHFHSQLTKNFEGRPVAFIDAFRYDHHDDVFAVIAERFRRHSNPRVRRRKSFCRLRASSCLSPRPLR